MDKLQQDILRGILRTRLEQIKAGKVSDDVFIDGTLNRIGWIVANDSTLKEDYEALCAVAFTTHAATTVLVDRALGVKHADHVVSLAKVIKEMKS